MEGMIASPETVSSTPSTLFPCNDCHLTFFCCPAHYDHARTAHKDTPNDPAFTGTKSVCEINWEILVNQRMSNAFAKSGDPPFLWAPERTLGMWRLVEPNWAAQFEDELKKELRGSVPDGLSLEPWLRAASDSLSFPMSILWALEKLNADDGWTKKETLNIHVRGIAPKG